MFVHGSYNHLFMNLVAAVQFGYPVYMEYGPIGLYTVFLCGGVFAALPSVLYLGQQKQVTKGYENVYSSICKRYLPSFFDSTVDGLSGWLGKTTNWLLTPSVSCGSSGAVFAMMGCNLGLLLHSLISTNADLFDLKYGQTKVFRLDGKVRTRHWSEWFAIVSKNIQRAIYKFITNPDSIWKVIQIISMIRYLLVELDFVIDLESLFRLLSVSVGLENLDTSFLWNVTGKQQNKSFAEVMEGGRIGHANHVQGMLFGLAYAGVFTFTLPYFAKKFR